MVRADTRWATLFTAAALWCCLPAQALYKVVGADGKVTYTDRVPSPADGKVTPLSPAGNSVAEPGALPYELRLVVQRYPVTLYVIADCAPCDSARALLRQRGIPHTEKLVQSEEDAEALQRIAGARDAPALTIGQQALRGLSADNWNAYLDSAGYPRESRLPAGYQFAPATPLTERREAQRPVPLTPRPLPDAPPVNGAPSASPGLRF